MEIHKIWTKLQLVKKWNPESRKSRYKFHIFKKQIEIKSDIFEKIQKKASSKSIVIKRYSRGFAAINFFFQICFQSCIFLWFMKVIFYQKYTVIIIVHLLGMSHKICYVIELTEPACLPTRKLRDTLKYSVLVVFQLSQLVRPIVYSCP